MFFHLKYQNCQRSWKSEVKYELELEILVEYDKPIEKNKSGKTYFCSWWIYFSGYGEVSVVWTPYTIRCDISRANIRVLIPCIVFINVICCFHIWFHIFTYRSSPEILWFRLKVKLWLMLTVLAKIPNRLLFLDI